MLQDRQGGRRSWDPTKGEKAMSLECHFQVIKIIRETITAGAVVTTPGVLRTHLSNHLTKNQVRCIGHEEKQSKAETFPPTRDSGGESHS